MFILLIKYLYFLATNEHKIGNRHSIILESIFLLYLIIFCSRRAMCVCVCVFAHICMHVRAISKLEFKLNDLRQNLFFFVHKRETNSGADKSGAPSVRNAAI